VRTGDDIDVPTTWAAIAASGCPAETLPSIFAPWVTADAPDPLGPEGAWGVSPPQAAQLKATSAMTPTQRDMRMSPFRVAGIDTEVPAISVLGADG
jgi:hypothetical protein